MRLESKIERAVVRDARQFGIPVIKMSMPGWPDRCFFIPGGRPLFCEFKQPGCIPDDLQQTKIEYLDSMGYDVIVATNYDSAMFHIKRLSKIGKNRLTRGDDAT